MSSPADRADLHWVDCPQFHNYAKLGVGISKYFKLPVGVSFDLTRM